VEVAKKMGINAFQFTNSEKFESDLKEFGVKLE